MAIGADKAPDLKTMQMFSECCTGRFTVRWRCTERMQLSSEFLKRCY